MECGALSSCVQDLRANRTDSTLGRGIILNANDGWLVPNMSLTPPYPIKFSDLRGYVFRQTTPVDRSRYDSVQGRAGIDIHPDVNRDPDPETDPHRLQPDLDVALYRSGCSPWCRANVQSK